MRPTVRGLARDVISNYRAENIYGVRRTEVRDGIKDILGIRMLAEGLELSDLIVRNVSFSDRVRQRHRDA